MPTDSLAVIVADVDGRYVDADEGVLAVLGYTLEELRALPVGYLSVNVDPGVSAAVWRKFVAGEIEFPEDRPIELRHRGGGSVPLTLAHIRPSGEPGRWAISLRLVPPDHEAPEALHVLLDGWLRAQRRLASLPADDPERAALKAEVDRLRALYAAESAVRTS